MMSFSYAPIRFVSGIGVVFCICAVIVAIEAIIEKITIGTPILGWASLMCVVCLASGVIMLTLGVLGEYIWRTLDASRNRPPYIIDVIRKDDN
jgi:dolichol-phosphate mannosyltransferase